MHNAGGAKKISRRGIKTQNWYAIFATAPAVVHRRDRRFAAATPFADASHMPKLCGNTWVDVRPPSFSRQGWRGHRDHLCLHRSQNRQ
jgi:hypothetical protein